MSRIPPGIRISVEANKAAALHWLGKGNFDVVSKFGMIQGLTTTWSTIMRHQSPGLYPEQVQPGGGGVMPVYAGTPTAQTLYLSTDDATDTTNVVEVQGLDANGNYQSDQKTMNGTNAVALAGTWCRVWRAFVVSGPGLSSSLAREIYVGADATPTGGIPASWLEWAQIGSFTGGSPNFFPANQTEMAFYTVPLGWNAYITGLQAGTFANNNPAQTAQAGLQLQTRSNPGPWRTREYINVSSAGSSEAANLFEGAIACPALTDIRMIGIGDNLPNVYARFGIFLVREE